MKDSNQKLLRDVAVLALCALVTPYAISAAHASGATAGNAKPVPAASPEMQKCAKLCQDAAAAYAQGNSAAAANLYQQALSALGPTAANSLPAAVILTNLGAVYVKQHKLDEARSAYRTSLEIKTRLLGPADPSTKATAQHLEAMGEFVQLPASSLDDANASAAMRSSSSKSNAGSAASGKSESGKSDSTKAESGKSESTSDGDKKRKPPAKQMVARTYAIDEFLRLPNDPLDSPERTTTQLDGMQSKFDSLASRFKGTSADRLRRVIGRGGTILGISDQSESLLFSADSQLDDFAWGTGAQVTFEIHEKAVERYNKGLSEKVEPNWDEVDGYFKVVNARTKEKIELRLEAYFSTRKLDDTTSKNSGSD